MSFLDVAAQPEDELGSVAGEPGAGPGDDLERMVFQFTTQVSKFRKLSDAVGTARDTHDSRLQVNAQGSSVKDLAREISRQLASAKGAPESRAKYAKLLGDFQAVLADFQRTHRACADKMHRFTPRDESAAPTRRRPQRSRAPSGDPFALDAGSREDEELLGSGDGGGQLALDSEIAFHGVLIEERERGIEEIQQQVGEVGEIFQDLAALVSEQGDQVDDIESNIVSAHGHTDMAGRELTRASKHQKAAGRMMCTVALVMVVLLVILMVISSV